MLNGILTLSLIILKLLKISLLKVLFSNHRRFRVRRKDVCVDGAKRRQEEGGKAHKIHIRTHNSAVHFVK